MVSPLCQCQACEEPGTPAAEGAGMRPQLQNKEASEGKVWQSPFTPIRKGTRLPRKGAGEHKGSLFPANPTQLRASTGSDIPGSFKKQQQQQLNPKLTIFQQDH